MHYVSNIEIKNPFIRRIALQPQRSPRRNFEFFEVLELIHFFECLERDIESFLLSHAHVEVVSPVSRVHLRNLMELLLDGRQFFDYQKCVTYLL